MTREQFLNFAGLALLVICFVIALTRVFSRTTREADPNLVKIRFAHWQLESGVRDAFEVLAREYEALHPGVEVEQMAIPEKIAKNWSRTQLVGGTAPDIIQLGSVMGTNDETLSRYFVPLSEYVDDPNPYNAGTNLAEMPWRETFIDGLSGGTNYVESLLDYYGIPSSMYTVRIYYNRDLWRQILGDEQVPETYEDFIKICHRATGFENADGERIIAIAGSKYNAPYVMEALFGSQTQKLRLAIDANHDLTTPSSKLALAYLDGVWDWDLPAIQSGLELMMRTGKYMQPGFLSLGRDDALFYFAQQRALMISTGSWDSTSLRVQAPFEIGVFRIPLPSTNHPEYGQYTLGQTSEAGVQTGLSFGLTNESKHPEVALDFLRFLTSKETNAMFSRVSGWLPSVVGVEVPEDIAPFEPETDGYTAGMRPPTGVGADTQRVFENYLHRLVGPAGTIRKFTDSMKDRFADALISDLQRAQRNRQRSAATKDAPIAAYQFMGMTGENPDAEARLDQMLEAQHEQETDYYYHEHELKRLGVAD